MNGGIHDLRVLSYTDPLTNAEHQNTAYRASIQLPKGGKPDMTVWATPLTSLRINYHYGSALSRV